MSWQVEIEGEDRVEEGNVRTTQRTTQSVLALRARS